MFHRAIDESMLGAGRLELSGFIRQSSRPRCLGGLLCSCSLLPVGFSSQFVFESADLVPGGATSVELCASQDETSWFVIESECGDQKRVAMIDWKSVDPARFERAVQALLKRLHPGLESLDGAGGDGGRDAQLVTPDGTWVFEMKSFTGALASKQREQIKTSLMTAVEKAPGMTKWTLVIPKNKSPRMKKNRYSDQGLFEDTLPAHAPGVELEWLGQDWLDLQASEHLDFQKYVEGPEAQLLQRAKEYGMESEVMTAGGLDLFRRNETLRKRADEISMHWRLSYLVTRDLQTFTLEEKYPGAAQDDPIVLRPTFRFDLLDDDGTAAELQSRFEQTLAFGGRVEVPGEFIESFEVDASHEARLLLGACESEPTSLVIESITTTLDPPVAGLYAYLEPDGTEAAALEVYFRERTGGSDGVTLHGGDAAGLLSLTVALPLPPSDHVAGTVPSGAMMSIETHDLAGQRVEAAARLTALLAAAVPERRMRLEVDGGIELTGQPLQEASFPDVARVQDVVRALVRLQRNAGKRLLFPRNMTEEQADMLLIAARLLDGEQITIPGDEWSVPVAPPKVGAWLKQCTDVDRFQLLFSRPEAVLVAGDQQIPYGPLCQWGPELSLANRTELEAHDGQSPVKARLATNGNPVCWLPYAKAAEIAAADIPSAI